METPAFPIGITPSGFSLSYPENVEVHGTIRKNASIRKESIEPLVFTFHAIADGSLAPESGIFHFFSLPEKAAGIPESEDIYLTASEREMVIVVIAALLQEFS